MNLDHVPSTVRRYEVGADTLEETWGFMRDRGRLGVEGVVLWVGHVPDPTRAEVLAAIQPRQIAYRGPDGLSVEVPQDALTELITALPVAVHVLVRVHSHADAAFHSLLDDTNLLIAHEGAISVVIPHFGRGPTDLLSCSVNILSRDTGWRELSKTEVDERFNVT